MVDCICGKCKRHFKLDEKHIGKKVNCKCGFTFRVGEDASATPVPTDGQKLEDATPNPGHTGSETVPKSGRTTPEKLPKASSKQPVDNEQAATPASSSSSRTLVYTAVVATIALAAGLLGLAVVMQRPPAPGTNEVAETQPITPDSKSVDEELAPAPSGELDSIEAVFGLADTGSSDGEPPVGDVAEQTSKDDLATLLGAVESKDDEASKRENGGSIEVLLGFPEAAPVEPKKADGKTDKSPTSLVDLLKGSPSEGERTSDSLEDLLNPSEPDNQKNGGSKSQGISKREDAADPSDDIIRVVLAGGSDKENADGKPLAGSDPKRQTGFAGRTPPKDNGGGGLFTPTKNRSFTTFQRVGVNGNPNRVLVSSWPSQLPPLFVQPQFPGQVPQFPGQVTQFPGQAGSGIPTNRLISCVMPRPPSTGFINGQGTGRAPRNGRLPLDPSSNLASILNNVLGLSKRPNVAIWKKLLLGTGGPVLPPKASPPGGTGSINPTILNVSQLVGAAYEPRNQTGKPERFAFSKPNKYERWNDGKVSSGTFEVNENKLTLISSSANRRTTWNILSVTVNKPKTRVEQMIFDNREWKKLAPGPVTPNNKLLSGRRFKSKDKNGDRWLWLDRNNRFTYITAGNGMTIPESTTGQWTVTARKLEFKCSTASGFHDNSIETWAIDRFVATEKGYSLGLNRQASGFKVDTWNEIEFDSNAPGPVLGDYLYTKVFPLLSSRNPLVFESVSTKSPQRRLTIRQFRNDPKLNIEFEDVSAGSSPLRAGSLSKRESKQRPSVILNGKTSGSLEYRSLQMNTDGKCSLEVNWPQGSPNWVTLFEKK
ncbi:MAG: hypothetical protein P8J33_02785 [Pirellulaceae bacterium]|nr:hypothetical protein [Pirellulaceae bacterium]